MERKCIIRSVVAVSGAAVGAAYLAWFWSTAFVAIADATSIIASRVFS